MIIFQLAVYSCVTVTSFMGGDVLSTTCRWDSRGLYAEQSRCDEDGFKAIGEPIHEFSKIINATPRKVEKHACGPVSVIK
jgi:hypothetical protein